MPNPQTQTAVDTVSCQHCADMIPLDDAVIINEDYLCEDCADTQTTVCGHCGERIWNEDDYGDSTISLCQHCRDYVYHACCECGSLIRRDDASFEEDDDDGDNPYCPECYGHVRSSPIHRFDYKPELVFYGSGSRFFGVELEVDDAGKDSDNAEAALSVLNAKQELGYIKSDGSLNDGFELVLHPMTLDFHLSDEMPWRQVLDCLKRMGYYSHLTSTCGLHVHVNRSTFGNTEEEQEYAIAAILYLFERFWEEILRFSRRTEDQVRKWADRYGYKNSGMAILAEAKNAYAGRYSCVNLTNAHTIEFRVFRGTLRLNTILATLEFLDLICDTALTVSERRLCKFSWMDLMLRIDPEKMPHLVRYLKERRMYINEPIEPQPGEEE
ncbi:amidoligase family protein [Ruminococcaceae bacterium OttesenSCG-928-A11]|nr:amidoligase family protein [Ruminococcaceae bacterium OttesenSCG-928-A11]